MNDILRKTDSGFGDLQGPEERTEVITSKLKADRKDRRSVIASLVLGLAISAVILTAIALLSLGCKTA